HGAAADPAAAGRERSRAWHCQPHRRWMDSPARRLSGGELQRDHRRGKHLRSGSPCPQEERCGTRECSTKTRYPLWEQRQLLGRQEGRDLSRWHGAARRAASSDRMKPSDGKIRAVIVDDEDLARQVVRELLAEHSEI